MIIDPDILRYAKAQIDRHGDDAPSWAARQADIMLECGNLGGERLWLRILEAIKALQATELPAGTVVQ
jgi:hypothetical protein